MVRKSGLSRFAAKRYPWETGRIPLEITPDYSTRGQAP
jgi:hypothetical protein